MFLDYFQSNHYFPPIFRFWNFNSFSDCMLTGELSIQEVIVDLKRKCPCWFIDDNPQQGDKNLVWPSMIRLLRILHGYCISTVQMIDCDCVHCVRSHFWLRHKRNPTRKIISVFSVYNSYGRDTRPFLQAAISQSRTASMVRVINYINTNLWEVISYHVMLILAILF